MCAVSKYLITDAGAEDSEEDMEVKNLTQKDETGEELE